MIRPVIIFSIIVLLCLFIPNIVSGSVDVCDVEQSALFTFSLDKANYKVKIKNVGADSIYIDFIGLHWSGIGYFEDKCGWNDGSFYKISKWLIPDSCISFDINSGGVFDDTTSLYHIELNNYNCYSFTLKNTTDINGNRISTIPCRTASLLGNQNNINKKSKKANRAILLSLNKKGNVVIIYKNMEYGLNGKMKAYKK